MPDYLFLIASVILFVLSIPASCLIVRYKLKKRSFRIFSAVMNASDYGQIVFDAKGGLLQMNDLAKIQLSTLIDCETKNVTQSGFLDYLYDHAVDYDESIKNTIMGHFDVSSNDPEFCEVIRCDEEILCLVNARKLDGDITLFTITDISAGQRREEQLKHLDTLSYQLLQAVQATSTGIMISDPKQEGNPVLFANDAFCAFTDSDLEDLADEGWDILSTLFTDMHERTKFEKALLEYSEAELELEDARDKKNGEIRYYTLTFSPVYYAGKVDLFIGLLSDVTLLKQREIEFFRAQRLESLGGLAAGIAHDFNNVLSIISGYCTMMGKILPDELEKERGYLEKIDSASRRGANLTRKMLTFSSHKVVEKEILDMCDFVAEQVAFFEPLLGANLKMDITIPEKLCKSGVCIRGSSSSIEQILMNLVVNARDAMIDGGILRVNLSCLDKGNVPQTIIQEMDDVEEFVCLSVADNGMGMEQQILERIFDPFFTTKGQGKGSGLGLSVVYGLVNELGGHLDVETKLDKGTTMSVYLPRYVGVKPKKEILGDIDQPETIRLDGYTILVAEDEPDLCEVVVSMLEDLGLKVLSAPNGTDALVCQDDYDGKIDVLLTDVLMPEVNGVKLAELLMSLRPDTKVIFMSGFPARGDMAPVELPKDAVFIAKPMIYEKLAQMLCHTLSDEKHSTEGVINDVVDMARWKHSDKIMGGDA